MMSSANGNSRAEANARLLRAAQRGDRAALDKLFSEELPSLRRWARAHVPPWMHARLDADDTVQLAAIKTLRRLHHLDPVKYPSIQPYMRQAVLNLIRDEARRAGRAPESVPLDGVDVIYQTSPADRLFGQSALRTYREAMKALTPAQRDCIVARIHRGLSYEEIAKRLRRPSADAARVAVGRALECLAEAMRVAARNRRPKPASARARPRVKR